MTALVAYPEGRQADATSLPEAQMSGDLGEASGQCPAKRAGAYGQAESRRHHHFPDTAGQNADLSTYRDENPAPP